MEKRSTSLEERDFAGACIVVRDKFEELWKKAQEVRRVDSLLHTQDEVFETEVKTKYEGRLKINLLALSIELLKSVEKIKKKKPKEVEKNGADRTKRKDSPNIQSSNDSEGNSLQDAE